MERDLYRTLCIITFSFFFFVSRARCQLEDDTSKDVDTPGGKYYSYKTCQYSTEAGYTCLSCSRALHCYQSNFAILVDCPRIMPYCFNGRCSRTKGAKCFEEKISTTPPHILADELTSHNDTIADSSTILSTEEKVTTTDDLTSETQENIETNTGVSISEV